jgi:HEPN pEK499 p136
MTATPPRATHALTVHHVRQEDCRMNYEDLITDFAKRTLANLDLVKRAAAQENPDAFEVTQIWNSLLGLIVAPHELEVRRLPRRQLAQLHADGWPAITTAGQLQSDTLRGLVGTLRNAVAHFNGEFHASGSGEIQQVSMWNDATDDEGRPDPNLSHRWDGRLDVDQLEQLARKIAATYVDELGTRVA